MSVRKLAATVDFSPSFISQLERNKVSPSISSLERLAAALGASLGDFFKAESASTVIRRGTRQSVTSGWSRARIEALDAAHPGRMLEAVMVTIASRGTSGKRPHAHEQEKFVIVLAGAVRLTLGESTFVMRKGDSVTLPVGAPHRWENHGKHSASLVIVSTRR
jgi:quercetin dioxygenase-like cupin family protein